MNTTKVVTKREKQIVKLICDGLTSKQIGEQLSITKNTVDTHRRKILKKIDGHNLADMVKYAFKNGIIKL